VRDLGQSRRYCQWFHVFLHCLSKAILLVKVADETFQRSVVRACGA
jgi:hypothetical protein